MRHDIKQGKRSLSRAEAALTSFGLDSVAIKILGVGLSEPVVLNFGSLKQAKRVQTAFYNWLWFYPWAKTTVSFSLNEEIGELTIKPKTAPEKRGRRGSK